MGATVSQSKDHCQYQNILHLRSIQRGAGRRLAPDPTPTSWVVADKIWPVFRRSLFGVHFMKTCYSGTFTILIWSNLPGSSALDRQNRFELFAEVDKFLHCFWLLKDLQMSPSLKSASLQSAFISSPRSCRAAATNHVVSCCRCLVCKASLSKHMNASTSPPELSSQSNLRRNIPDSIPEFFILPEQQYFRRDWDEGTMMRRLLCRQCAAQQLSFTLWSSLWAASGSICFKRFGNKEVKICQPEPSQTLSRQFCILKRLAFYLSRSKFNISKHTSLF